MTYKINVMGFFLICFLFTNYTQVHAIEKSKLDLTLVGTIVHSDATKSIASIKPKAYVPDEKIQNIAKLVSVSRFRATILNLKTKKTEYIEVGPYNPKEAIPKAGIFKAKNKTFHIKKELVDRVTGELPKFLKDAGTQPVYDKFGKITGFKLTFIKSGGVFSGLGLNEGDILTEVNGYKLDSLTSAMYIYNQLRDSSMVNLSVSRGGKVKDFTYLIR